MDRLSFLRAEANWLEPEEPIDVEFDEDEGFDNWREQQIKEPHAISISRHKEQSGSSEIHRGEDRR